MKIYIVGDEVDPRVVSYFTKKAEADAHWNQRLREGDTPTFEVKDDVTEVLETMHNQIRYDFDVITSLVNMIEHGMENYGWIGIPPETRKHPAVKAASDK